MAVYVDNMQALFGRMIMCHMIADTPEELRFMLSLINVSQEWIQYPGTPKEHADICLKKRKLAVSLGAKEITMKQLAAMIKARKKK